MQQDQPTSRCGPIGGASRAFLFLIIAAVTGPSWAQQTAPDVTNQPLHKLGISAQDHRVKLENAGWPWTSLGRVNRAIGGYCTGALVAPHWALTAAHCLYNFADRRWAAPGDIHFVAGYDRGQYGGHAIAKRFILPTNYHGDAAEHVSEMAHDWALIELDRDLPEKPIPFARQDISLAGGPVTVTVAGYSGDFKEILTAHRNCQIISQTPPSMPKIWLHDCDATFGASGSPILHMTPGGVEIVGVQSGVVTLEDKREISTAAPLSSLLPALGAIR